ncbi:dihydrolipoamide acetyltransferase family protein [Desulforhopalus sp. 52FAK]
MNKTFSLPDLGEGVHEAEILAIPVSIGQSIREGDLLIEVETDKAAVEIPSPITGVISTIHVEPGDMIEVGEVLISFSIENSSPAEPSGDEEKRQSSETTVQSENLRNNRGLPVPASPSTRRLARELGVDLHMVTASSSRGVVSADDVRNYTEKAQRPAKQIKAAQHDESSVVRPQFVGSELPDFNQYGEVERHTFRSIRRATAQRMAQSWAEIPHVNCQDLVDITALEEFRQRHKDEITKCGGRLTMTVFTLKAVATALKAFPHFNATLDLANQEILIKQYFNIGIAVDTEHGLMVPVIRDVDRKSIKELSVEIHDAITKARKRKLNREELVGGSFTITNAGAIGGSHFSAIINHPEIAILGLGQARMQPAVMTDELGNHEIVPRLMMPIVLCFDHRVVDGADAIRFLQVIIKSLQDPDELFINMI